MAEFAYGTTKCIAGEGSAGWIWDPGAAYSVGFCGNRVSCDRGSGVGKAGECGEGCVELRNCNRET